MTNLNEVALIARKLMREHHIGYWRFEWNRAKRTFGLCNHIKEIIYLSEVLTPQRTINAITNTILHEIAHALVGAGNGHNHEWKMKALEIGCDAQRLTSDRVVVEYKYYGICPSCSVIFKRHRILKGGTSCGECNLRFNPDSLIKWVQRY